MRSTGVSARNLKRSWGNELHRDLAEFYKIKLLKDGYCLVYQVMDERIVIYVIAVGRRADNEIYALATKRTD